MSLQVWLPLTKDLRNQGLDNNYSVSTSTATYSSTEGKLGGCYNFSGTTGNGILLSGDVTTFMNTYINNHSWSMCAWVKNSVSDRSTPVISLTYGLRMTAGATTGISLYNTSRTVSCTSDVATGDGKWHHIVATYNVNTNAIKIYVDGINTGNATYTSGYTYASSWTNGLFIGRDPNNSTANASYFYQGAMNDVRIYDHCLSPMEVKELAKGLVLHYPLNRQGWGQENLFNWTNNATGITLYDYQNVGSFTQFTNSLSFDPSTTVGKRYTISFWAKSPNGTTSLLLYNSNSKPKYFNFSTTLTSNLGTEWQFLKYTVTNTQYTGSDANTNTSIWKRIEIYAPSQMKVQVKQIKVEEGEIATPWCPNLSDTLATTMGLNSTTEYDCSGFCNNGTRTGTFTWTSDTPKYSVSQYFEDYTRYISCPMGNNWIPDAITMSCWVKGTNKSARGGYHIPLNMHSTNFEISITSSSGKARMGYVVGGTRYVSDIGSDILDGKWHMLTSTFNGSTICRYIDGVLVNSENRSGVLTAAQTLGIGAFPGGTTYGNTQLYESDARIYATALSADDVKSLYQNSAYIDSSGNVYGAVHMEV